MVDFFFLQMHVNDMNNYFLMNILQKKLSIQQKYEDSISTPIVT